MQLHCPTTRLNRHRFRPALDFGIVSLADITRMDVLAAIDQFDQLGRQAFLEKYMFGEARKFFIYHGGHQYDSKAIVGVAHGLHGLPFLVPHDFTGGEKTVVRCLQNLGFDVRSNKEPNWQRDELILACDLVRENNWKELRSTDSRVVDLSRLLQLLPIHPLETRGTRFRSVGSVALKTSNIATIHPTYSGSTTHGGALDEIVLRDFISRESEMQDAAKMIRDGILSGSLALDPGDINDIDELDNAPEGRLLQRRHFARERSRSLRDKKIAHHLLTNDRLECSTCGFDFGATFGSHGNGYIECHHVVPLHASGETRTRLNDLILLCANCHRMIHRRSPWLTPDQLRDLIASPSD